MNTHEKRFLIPSEIASHCAETVTKKVQIPKSSAFVLAILAGAYIGFAVFGSNMAAYNLLMDTETYGLGKCLAGMIFTVGLILVIIGGAELFTGNTLIIVSVLEKKISFGSMLKNWVLVWVGNLAGSILVALLIVNTPLLDSSENLLAVLTIKIAVAKIEVEFISALLLGILCNWLVCLAVWLSYGARDIAGKILAIFFPIWLFVCSGFEHSVANMTYIPLGILAKANPAWEKSASLYGIGPEQLNSLNWSNMFIDNLLPVTIGNIIGGAFFVGTVYWYCYLRNRQ